MKKTIIMNLIKISVICLFCVSLVTGCANNKKKIVTPLPDSTYTQPAPYPGEDYPTHAEDPSPENPEQLQTISLHGQEQPDPNMEQGLRLTVDDINGRISEFERKLNRWREIDRQAAVVELSQEDTERMVNCFVDLQKLLDGYMRLKDDMLLFEIGSSTSKVSLEEIVSLQNSDITFLDSVCGRLLAPMENESIGGMQHEGEADLLQLETLIEKFSASGEYEEVVQVWQRIPEQQADSVHLRTKILYGNALMFLHQEEKAAETYQQVVDQMSVSDGQRTDLLSLRKVLADLYTAAGNYMAAEKQYLEISKDYRILGSLEAWSASQLDILRRSGGGGSELIEYSGLLRNFLGFIPDRDGFTIVWDADKFLQNYPYSAVASNVDIIKKSAKSKAEKWFDGVFIEVDQLVAEKNYLGAIEKLETIPEDIVSVDQLAQIKVKNDDLILAEAVGRETSKIEKKQELQSQWNEGMLLVDEGKYDEAIVIFKTLEQTDYFAKAEDKIKEITLLAAKTDRRAAADLYIQYTKTYDLETKKQLLTKSRRLLSNILVKYPDVNIVDKVKGNIERVEQEMNLLDPELLPRLKLVEQEEKQEDEDFAFSQSPSAQPVAPAMLKEEDLTN